MIEPVGDAHSGGLERLLEACAAGPEHGWLELARAERAGDPADSPVHARGR